MCEKPIVNLRDDGGGYTGICGPHVVCTSYEDMQYSSLPATQAEQAEQAEQLIFLQTLSHTHRQAALRVHSRFAVQKRGAR